MSRQKFEANFEDVLSALDAGAGEKFGYCKTITLSQKDFGNAAWKAEIPMPYGLKAEIMSILIHNVTEAFDAAETLDVGIGGGGDADAYVDGATLPSTIAIGASERATLVDGVTGADSIPASGANLEISGTSVGTTGIADVSITFRYYL